VRMLREITQNVPKYKRTVHAVYHGDSIIMTLIDRVEFSILRGADTKVFFERKSTLSLNSRFRPWGSSFSIEHPPTLVITKKVGFELPSICDMRSVSTTPSHVQTKTNPFTHMTLGLGLGLRVKG
jgi:hypothetical protein